MRCRHRREPWRSDPAPSLVEPRPIEYIPPNEHHGQPNTLFTIWFASDAQITTVVTGLLATAIVGLSLEWAIIAIVIGNLVGALFMAYHPVQGPRLPRTTVRTTGTPRVLERSYGPA